MGGEPYIYIYICSHLISPCCSTCWSVFFRFSISSPGDFISFPHLFDHFIKGLISFPNLFDQFITQKKHSSHLFVHFIIWFHQLFQVFQIYFSSWSLQFFFSSPKFSQPVCACYHLISSVFPTNFGKIWKDPQFFMGKYGKIHNFSWENMERSTIFHGKIWTDSPFFMGKYGKIHHFHGKIWTDPPFFMGKYGQIHHFSWENMERSTIFHGKQFHGTHEKFSICDFLVVLKWKTIRIKMLGYFFLLGFVSRMYSSLTISFSLCHSATSF